MRNIVRDFVRGVNWQHFPKNGHLLGDTTGGTPVAPVNGQDARSPSLFWHAATPSNTRVVSWIGGLYARSHTNLVDFQAEIFNDGSFDYRYADRTEHFAASLPFDLDGDGLENSVDPDPLTAGPDAHGTNAEWYNTVCSNVLEAVASGSTGTTGILPVAVTPNWESRHRGGDSRNVNSRQYRPWSRASANGGWRGCEPRHRQVRTRCGTV